MAGGAAQQGADARHQLPRREGLGEVVVDAGIVALELVSLFTAGGEHDDRQLRSEGVPSQPRGQIHTAHARQHPVDDGQARQLTLEQAECLLGALGLPHREAGAAQREREHLPNLRFVFHDKDGVCCVIHRARAWLSVVTGLVSGQAAI